MVPYITFHNSLNFRPFKMRLCEWRSCSSVVHVKTMERLTAKRLEASLFTTSKPNDNMHLCVVAITEKLAVSFQHGPHSTLMKDDKITLYNVVDPAIQHEAVVLALSEVHDVIAFELVNGKFAFYPNASDAMFRGESYKQLGVNEQRMPTWKDGTVSEQHHGFWVGTSHGKVGDSGSGVFDYFGSRKHADRKVSRTLVSRLTRLLVLETSRDSRLLGLETLETSRDSRLTFSRVSKRDFSKFLETEVSRAHPERYFRKPAISFFFERRFLEFFTLKLFKENELMSFQLVNSKPVRGQFCADLPVSCQINECLVTSGNNSCLNSSSGIVIFSKNGTGEVLTQEAFDDSGLHFIFTDSTNIEMTNNYNPLGIGSVVQIYWSRSFERVVVGNHIIVPIERMEVYKCCAFLEKKVFVVFNSQSTAGVAMGVTERNMMVAFHPNCSPEIREKTLRAHNEGHPEFRPSYEYKNFENTNRMVSVVLAAVPFKIEMSGSIEKVPFIVMRKIEDVPSREGLAIITKVVKHFFMEATFLKTPDVVFFDANSCHSNILDKVAVGSYISVLASPTFPSSCFQWYGYDVTICNVSQMRHTDENENFPKLEEKIIFVAPIPKNARDGDKSIKNDVVFNTTRKTVGKKRTVLPCYSNNAQFRHRHFLLNRRICGSLETSIYPQAKDFLEHFHPIRSSDYSSSLKKFIRNVLKPFGLHKDISGETSHKDELVCLKPQTIQKNRQPRKLSRKTLERIMDGNGFSNQSLTNSKFVLPDTAWSPKERRYIGIYDDMEWVLMATFWKNIEQNAIIVEEVNERQLMGGWWYRRTVPRDVPVTIVKTLHSKRNVVKDCEM
ncbi:unnamed protein product [Caenorhabditis sp. 36 PRJEB53466]|nr:unnamed protein product [Caenorhabditis sp. 36 PRJEB53466]